MPKTFFHFGVHNTDINKPIAVNANAGDTLLFQATRDLFTHFLGPIDWKLEPLWEEVTAEKTRLINEKGSAVLVGGGGLFLRDQKGADAANSGWQWNCPPERIKEITLPLIVFGVGYNRFRGQGDFDPVFSEQIKTVVEKSVFFGLRNHGSRHAVCRYLPPSLHHRVRYQPCPTTIASYIYKDLLNSYRPAGSGKTMVLNAAFDRHEMRFGDKEKNILEQLAGAVKRYCKEGWKIILANHKPQDAEMGKFLDAVGVSYESVDLSGVYPEEIINFYCDKDITIGMRGHAQMIPFGLGKPIVSIISHDKIGWFLDDIGHPEWGVDVEDSLFSEKLDKAIRNATENPEINKQIAAAQEKLWAVTVKNMEEIKAYLKTFQAV